MYSIYSNFKEKQDDFLKFKKENKINDNEFYSKYYCDDPKTKYEFKVFI